MSDATIRFIAYDINTAPKNATFDAHSMPSGIYLGLDDPYHDIDARCCLLERAIAVAAAQLPSTSPPEDGPLNVFMLPEFFFRGAQGAYQMVQADYTIRRLQQIAAQWENWVFVFGSIVAVSATTQADDEVYNFALVQQGGSAAQGDAGARLVMKELMSGIDFISQHANPGGTLLGGVEYIDAGSHGAGREYQQLNYDGSGIFDLCAMTWALEICLDHGDGRLQRSPQLPGSHQVQLQLIPSCGMEVELDSVVTVEGGLVFNCDGGGYGNGVNRLSADGSPPHRQMDPIAALSSNAVPDTPIELDSPPQAVAVDQLYARGAGSVVIYPPLQVPAPSTVGGTTRTLDWAAAPDVGFSFDFHFAEDGSLSALLCRMTLASLDFHDHDYFLPLIMDTQDRNKRPVKVEIRTRSGSAGYDGALWCRIAVPGFNFEGVAVEYYTDLARGEPFTIW